jgi:hypothetical protein
MQKHSATKGKTLVALMRFFIFGLNALEQKESYSLMSNNNPFMLAKDDYVRDINPVKQACEQSAHFLAIATGVPFEECRDWVRKELKEKTLGIQDPVVKFLERQENGDRVQLETTLLTYVKEAIERKDLIAPTLTTYISPEVYESVLVGFVDDNVAFRSRAKKAQFAAEAAGDKETEALKNTEQTNAKLSNNAVSGAHVSPSTPLFNRTAHSTLTSNCRSTSGYGNANNEKLLSGNRHYWSPDVVLNNIAAVTHITDSVKLVEVMTKYGLVYPSEEQVMECIQYSTNLYWHSPTRMEQIEKIVARLTPLQRAAFVYVGDLYHLMRFNQDFVRVFIEKLSRKVTGLVDDPKKAIKETHEDYVNLAHHICLDEARGIGKDYSKLSQEDVSSIALTAMNVAATLHEYSDLIRALWITQNVPASVAYFPESIRRAAITSDTDSTIFTVQDWVIWYKNGLSFDNEGIAVGATMIFLASQNIIHVLAMMSANFGIVKKRLQQVAMKNEFFFPVFVPTNVTKHYFATILCQEGNVKKHRETEIKGVHLKSSNAPKSVTKKATEMMESIMTTVYEGKKIKLIDYLTEVGDIQKNMEASIKRGEQEFFRLAEVKSPDSYKNPESSPYNFYELWQEAFSHKYEGSINVPYPAIKVATNLDTATETKAWLDGMEDRKVAEKIQSWMNRRNKKTLPTILIPLEMAKMHGIPKEILPVMGVRRMISDLTKIFSLILETLGFYSNEDVMIYDRYYTKELGNEVSGQ